MIGCKARGGVGSTWRSGWWWIQLELSSVADSMSCLREVLVYSLLLASIATTTISLSSWCAPPHLLSPSTYWFASERAEIHSDRDESGKRRPIEEEAKLTCGPNRFKFFYAEWTTTCASRKTKTAPKPMEWGVIHPIRKVEGEWCLVLLFKGIICTVAVVYGVIQTFLFIE